MNRMWHFIKWNFTDMRPESKRMIIYFLAGIGFAFVTPNGFFITPIAIFLDMTQDMIRSRYNDYRKEQQALVDTLKDSSK